MRNRNAPLIFRSRNRIFRRDFVIFRFGVGEQTHSNHAAKEDIKVREKVIKDFYARWISEHPDKKIWTENLQDYILVKYQSINETYNKAARRYESTLAVFRLTEVMEKAVLKSEKGTKPGDKNQKPYSKLLIMFHDGIKLTVGVQRTTQEKVQYCLTAVGATQEQ